MDVRLRVDRPARVFTGLYPVSAREQNELVRVVATRVERDGTMQRRMVDTAHWSDGPQWEDLAARALAVPPPYRPVPGTPSTTSAWMTALRCWSPRTISVACCWIW